MRWHSFQTAKKSRLMNPNDSMQTNPNNEKNDTDSGVTLAAMSAGQLQVLRKLALVVLTGYMERYCPKHKSGWNWELPKFVKKIKTPDYKDKQVFGVPLLLLVQRTGHMIPLVVRSAILWLQLNALDQIGLFRKSGVKSRIQKLKQLIDYCHSMGECMQTYDNQQAYDIADMLKQYFRDLPECLITNKLSETFCSIFQCTITLFTRNSYKVSVKM